MILLPSRAKTPTVLWLFFAQCWLALATAIHADEAQPIDFAKQIQPIFVAHCYSCHGTETQESNFRLDARQRAFDGGDFGEPAITPGDSDASPLIRYVSGADDDHTMPPKDEGNPLSREQVSLLKRWIDAGAPWPDELAGDADGLSTDHWSFQPITSVTPPVNGNTLGRNAIDAFVFRRLSERGIEPSPLADRVTLIRRIYLDMHGPSADGGASPSVSRRRI